MALNLTGTARFTTDYLFHRNGATLESTATELGARISGHQVAALRIISGGNVKYFYSGNKVRMTAANGVSPAMLKLLETHALVSSTGRGWYTATLTPLARKVLELKAA